MQPTDIRCLVVEDEQPAQQVLSLHISRLPFLHLQAIVDDATKALTWLKEGKIDLLFTDIHLPGITGLQLAGVMPSTTGVIFTTAHDSYAVQGFELNAVDYLLKPVSFDRFETAVNRYLRHFHQQTGITATLKENLQRPFLFIRCERKMTKIFLDDILYLEAQRNYLLIQTTTDAHRTYQSISEVEEKLPTGHFLRVHRSFIVSVAQVKAVNARQISIGKYMIPIGRVYNKEVMETIGLLRGDSI
jgi:DNA-binding LytR/AlgR family response regulator